MSFKPHLIATLVLGLGLSTMAQLPTHQFALRLGYSNDVDVADIAVDNEGNIYAVGNFTTTIDLDPGPNEELRISQGSDDFFLVKVDADGGYLWGRVYGNAEANRCSAIAYDPLSGVIVLGGTTTGTINFDGITVTFESGETDAFLYKLDTTGTPLWANEGASSFIAGETLSDIVLDSVGDIYYTGSTISSGSGNAQIAVVKRTGEGQAAASYLYGGLNSDGGTHLAIGHDGDLNVLGTFRYRSSSPYDVSFGSFTFNSGSTLDFGSNIVYLKIAAADGTVLAAKVTAHRADDERPTSIVVDGSGSVYITGQYGASTGVAGAFGVGLPQVTGIYRNGFIVKLHPNGATGSWARAFPVANNQTSIDAVGVDGSGRVLVFGVGTTGLDIDPTMGSVLPLPAGNTSFLTRFNADGSFYDGYFLDRTFVNQLLMLEDGSVILGGEYGTGADFDPGPDIVTLPAASQIEVAPDGFVSKLNTCVLAAIENVDGPSLSATVVPDATYQWIDCDSGEPINGATSSNYTADANGQYAVAMTVDGCTTLSDCELVLNVSITPAPEALHGLVYDPTSASLTILGSGTDATYTVLGLAGQVLLRGRFSAPRHVIDLQSMAAGAYLVQLVGRDGAVQTRRFVVTGR